MHICAQARMPCIVCMCVQARLKKKQKTLQAHPPSRPALCATTFAGQIFAGAPTVTPLPISLLKISMHSRGFGRAPFWVSAEGSLLQLNAGWPNKGLLQCHHDWSAQRAACSSSTLGGQTRGCCSVTMTGQRRGQPAPAQRWVAKQGVVAVSP